jgi:hypothetical protein
LDDEEIEHSEGLDDNSDWETCDMCRRPYHVACMAIEGGEQHAWEVGRCLWCLKKGDAVLREIKGMFRVEDVPPNPGDLLRKVRKCLPLLPQCTVDLPAYEYTGDSLMRKGPKTERVAFIMPFPWMERDLRSEEFINSLKCVTGVSVIPL